MIANVEQIGLGPEPVGGRLQHAPRHLAKLQRHAGVPKTPKPRCPDYNLLFFSNPKTQMVETVEKSRAWPKADNKLSKEIVELLNQSVHAKQV